MMTIDSRLVPDPMITDAEYLYRQAVERALADKSGRPPNLDVGRVWVRERQITRLGALCYIRRPKRQLHHEMAAERFKSTYEACYGVASPAIDPSRVSVDTSPIAHDSGMAAAVDRARELRRWESGMGPDAFGRLVALVVLCAPAGEGLHWRARSAAIDQVLADLGRLAGLMGYASRTAA